MDESKAGKSIKAISLRVKLVLGITLMGILITAGTIIVGAMLYRKSIITQYNHSAYNIATTVKELFTEDELREYTDLVLRFTRGQASQEEIDAVTSSERYIFVKDELDKMRLSMETNDIFVIAIDEEILTHFDQEAYDNKEWKPLCYVSDSYEQPEYNMPMGSASGILSTFVDAMVDSTRTGKKTSDPLIAKGTFGYNTTAMLPITIDGATVGFVGVEIPMSTLESDLRTFITQIIMIALIIMIAAIVLGSIYIDHGTIRPIKLIGREVQAFSHDHTKISDKLDQIKTKDEIQLLGQDIKQMEIDMNSYIENLTSVTAEKERIGAELSVAARIQEGALPNIFPPFPDRNEFDIFASMTPAKEVGGDFYDFFLIDDDHLGLVMADVSGKGVPAALFMMISKNMIKDRALLGGTPAEILMEVNDKLCANNEAEMFVTVWFGIMEISTGHVIATNAGHEFPVIKSANGDFELMKDKHGFVVAGMEGVRYKNYEFDIEKGGKFFIYTDGVAEATNAENELFGTERMVDALNANKNDVPTELLPNIKKSIDGFVKDAPQFDDITMMCVEYKGKE